MTDGRRRQWIAWDTNFNAGLGADIREEFGVCGCWVFNSFIVACKKNTVQGQMSYTNEPEALMMMGLPGLVLINEQKAAWVLDDLWLFLSRKKQVRRRISGRGRVTTVISTKWEQWQKPPVKTPASPADHSATAARRGAQHDEPSTNGSGTSANPLDNHVSPPQKPRSDTKNTEPLGGANSSDTNPDLDSYPDPDLDSYKDPDSAPARSAIDDAIDLHHGQQTKISLTGGEEKQLRGLIDRLEAMCRGDNRTAVRQDAMLVIAECVSCNVPLDVLEKAINELGKGSPVMPRALKPVVTRHCQRRGLPAPMLTSIVRSA